VVVRALIRHSEPGALVLECTHLPPQAAALHRATGLPVRDRGTVVHQRWTALPIR